jgi:hypothetical protein
MDQLRLSDVFRDLSFIAPDILDVDGGGILMCSGKEDEGTVRLQNC